MRVAALYDIHANLPALEAVLGDIRQAQVDQIVVGGDVVPGPMGRETIACLLDLDIPALFIQGNGDREVVSQISGIETDWFRSSPERWREPVRSSAQQLDAKHARLLADWPKTLSLEIPRVGEVLFCHATPRNDTEMFTRMTPEAALLPVFAEVDAPVVVCGHTHMQFDRMIGKTRVVNAGSVGMPFGDPGAYWLSCSDPTFNCAILSTILRKLRNVLDARGIHRRKISRRATSCNPHPRERHSKRLPASK
jgi:predicted phosphodiesterase